MTSIKLNIGGDEYDAEVDFTYDRAFDEFTIDRVGLCLNETEVLDLSPMMGWLGEFEDYVVTQLINALEAEV